MKNTCKELQKIFPVILDISCSAHILQLCLKNISKIPEINLIVMGKL